MVECRRCKVDTETRVVIKRKPLKRYAVTLPEISEEYICCNIIKFKRKNRRIGKWIIEKCNSHIIILNKSEV